MVKTFKEFASMSYRSGYITPSVRENIIRSLSTSIADTDNNYDCFFSNNKLFIYDVVISFSNDINKPLIIHLSERIIKELNDITTLELNRNESNIILEGVHGRYESEAYKLGNENDYEQYIKFKRKLQRMNWGISELVVSDEWDVSSVTKMTTIFDRMELDIQNKKGILNKGDIFKMNKVWYVIKDIDISLCKYEIELVDQPGVRSWIEEEILKKYIKVK